MLMENGTVSEVYNIGSGKPQKTKEILDILVSLSAKKINIEIDKDKVRPSDVPIIQCDNSKIKSKIGWNLEYDIKDTLDYWRNKLNLQT